MGRAKREGELPVSDCRDCVLADGGEEAERASISLKMKKPQCGNTEASESEINFEEEIVMSNDSINVIPFNFGKRQVRTLLIGYQPWFVASDVSAALLYSEASAMTRHLDEDEKGLSIVQTHGGDQEMLVINESGLYSAILRSRKAEAKLFKKWVTAEVLPAIRKHGRYEVGSGKMATLIGTVIGSDGEHVLDRVIDQKANAMPTVLRRSFKHTIKSRLRTRFNVQKTALIPAEELANACNFVAAYVFEGDLLPKREQVQIIGEPFKRYLVAFNHKGEQSIDEVPKGAYVLSQHELMAGMVATPGDIPVSIPDMFQFLMAAVVNLKCRYEYMARREAK